MPSLAKRELSWRHRNGRQTVQCAVRQAQLPPLAEPAVEATCSGRLDALTLCRSNGAAVILAGSRHAAKLMRAPATPCDSKRSRGPIPERCNNGR